ncbi:retrovirus-related pol polyprotein from transposon TNT 1-94 [Tanacetum coccineum]
MSLQESSSPTLICFMAKASSTQAWLWHCCLSHLNFDTINLLSKNDIVNGLKKLKYVKGHLCSSCELGKAKRGNSRWRQSQAQKDLCGPMRVEIINGKKYIHMVVDDYSMYTWTHFLRYNNEKPEVLVNFLWMIQRGLQAQKGVVKRRSHTLIEVARTMLRAAKLPLFFWAEAIATTCYTQNRSLVIPRHEKTPYHIINDRKPSLKFLHIFSCTCYIVIKVYPSLPLSDNQQHDTPPKFNAQPTLELTTPTTNVNAEEINNDQVEDAQFDAYEFKNLFATPVTEVDESSSHNVDT